MWIAPVHNGPSTKRVKHTLWIQRLSVCCKRFYKCLSSEMCFFLPLTLPKALCWLQCHHSTVSWASSLCNTLLWRPQRYVLHEVWVTELFILTMTFLLRSNPICRTVEANRFLWTCAWMWHIALCDCPQPCLKCKKDTWDSLILIASNLCKEWIFSNVFLLLYEEWVNSYLH